MRADSRRRAYYRRRRQVQRQRILLGWVLLVMVSLLIICVGSKNQESSEAQKAVKSGSQKDADQIKKISVEVETPEEQIARIKEEAKEKGYPDSIIELLDKNEETASFVEHYGEKKDEPAAETIGDALKAGEIPQLYQWDERWGYTTYGTSNIAVSGCGPTCMAMVAAGLTNDPTITPAKTAAYGMENGYVDENNDTYWRYMKEAGANWNLSCYDAVLTEAQVRDELTAGKPIICTVGPGDFTQNGHFIVLTHYEDGKVRVNDPFSQKNSSKEWVFADIADQIKAMWVYSVKQ